MFSSTIRPVHVPHENADNVIARKPGSNIKQTLSRKPLMDRNINQNSPMVQGLKPKIVISEDPVCRVSQDDSEKVALNIDMDPSFSYKCNEEEHYDDFYPVHERLGKEKILKIAKAYFKEPDVSDEPPVLDFDFILEVPDTFSHDYNPKEYHFEPIQIMDVELPDFNF